MRCLRSNPAKTQERERGARCAIDDTQYRVIDHGAQLFAGEDHTSLPLALGLTDLEDPHQPMKDITISSAV
jgi:hypothetical protein